MSLQPLFGVIIALVIIEGAVVDSIVAAAVPGSAWVWILLGLHLYAVVMLLGMRASFRLRPHRVLDGTLHLNDGVFTQVTVPVSAIRQVRAERTSNFGRSGFKVDPGQARATLAFGDETVVLLLDSAQLRVNGEPCRAPVCCLSLTVDEPQRFVTCLTGLSGR